VEFVVFVRSCQLLGIGGSSRSSSRSSSPAVLKSHPSCFTLLQTYAMPTNLHSLGVVVEQHRLEAMESKKAFLKVFELRARSLDSCFDYLSVYTISHTIISNKFTFKKSNLQD